jgi:hypothetical protein
MPDIVVSGPPAGEHLRLKRQTASTIEQRFELGGCSFPGPYGRSDVEQQWSLPPPPSLASRRAEKTCASTSTATSGFDRQSPVPFAWHARAARAGAAARPLNLSPKARHRKERLESLADQRLPPMPESSPESARSRSTRRADPISGRFTGKDEESMVQSFGTASPRPRSLQHPPQLRACPLDQ